MSNNLARPPFGIVKCVMPRLLFPIDNLALTNFRLAPPDFPYANAKIVPAGFKEVYNRANLIQMETGSKIMSDLGH